MYHILYHFYRIQIQYIRLHTCIGRAAAQRIEAAVRYRTIPYDAQKIPCASRQRQ